MRLVLIVILGLAPIYLLAQLISESGVISVQTGAVLTVHGSFQAHPQAEINTAGSILIEKDLLLEGTSTFTPASSITFTGTQASDLRSDQSIPNLHLQKEGAEVQLSSDLTIESQLTFGTTATHLNANGHRVRFLQNADIHGFHKDAYIITSNSESIVKESLQLFTFPLGTSTAYTPIELEEKGEIDDKTLRLYSGPYENPLSQEKTIETKVVGVSWEIEEEVLGGSLLDISVQWDAALQKDSFDPKDCGLARYQETYNRYDLLEDQMGSALGDGPYKVKRSACSEVGFFAVGADPLMDYLAIQPQITLEGAFDGTLHTDALLKEHSLPLEEPYDFLLAFKHVARGGGASVSAYSEFDASEDENDIVDWVFVALSNGLNDSTIVATKSALLQRDGDVVDLDGGPVKMLGLPEGDYHCYIGHRNHLPILSRHALSLSKTLTEIDFSSGQVEVDPSYPVRQLKSQRYALISGDINQDGAINAQDRASAWNFRDQRGYHNADVNLDHQVDEQDRNLIWNNKNYFIKTQLE